MKGKGEYFIESLSGLMENYSRLQSADNWSHLKADNKELFSSPYRLCYRFENLENLESPSYPNFLKPNYKVLTVQQ